MTEALSTAIRERVASQYQQALSQLAAVGVGSDIEALHRYRVCLRKSRCLLTLFAEPLVDTPAASLADSFKVQASATGELRDLDVFVAGLADNPLRAFFVTKRILAHRQALQRLDALTREQRLCQELLKFTWNHSAQTLGESVILVAEGLRKKIVARSQRALRSNKSSHWHRVRLLIKKQRYLVELCLPDGRTGQAKAWQERLGQFNDSCTQLALLQSALSDKATRAFAKQQIAKLKTQKRLKKQQLQQLCKEELHKKSPFALLG